MAQKQPRSDWYSDSLRSGGDGGAIRREHRGMRVTMLIVCVLILIVGTSLLFRDRGAFQTPAASGSGFFNEPPAGSGGSVETPVDPDDYSDFRDFFRSYYSGSASRATPDVQGSAIPRADTDGSMRLTLAPSDGRRELSLQELYERCAETVVGIRAARGSLSYAWGTGVLVSADGYIVTNQHIIDGASAAEVVLTDGRTLEALLVGEDSFTDIAVLKVEAEGLPFAELGDSEDLSVGDRVAAIGNPISIELSGTMTDGIISAINRDISVNGRHITLLQTNAALNEGNSGGPLFNMYGQVVGITNMKMVNYSSAAIFEGIGFAIPTVTVKSVADQLLAHGETAPHPGIGVTLGPVPEEAQQRYSLPEGLYVSDVARGSDAAAKGVRVGDVVTHVNGEHVTSTEDVLDIRDRLSVGDEITMTIYRDGESFDVSVALVDITRIY